MTLVIDRLKIDENSRAWFAMQATYRRELKAKTLLEEDGVYSFIPMRSIVSQRGSSKELKLTPVIQNLIFVLASPSYMRTIKSKIPYIQFKYEIRDKKSFPIVVPERQMNSFIKLYEATDTNELQFIEPAEAHQAKGKRVRIHGGKLDGIEGELIKVKGKRRRQLSVSIGDFIAVTTDVDMDLVEILKL